MKDLKYLFAYTIPLAAYVSFSSLGSGTFAAVIYAFVVIPFFDVIFGQNETNPSDSQKKSKAINKFFDWMLYLNLPIVFGLLSYCLFQVSTKSYTTLEWIGLSLSAGILLATNAINVAHELGHRKSFFERVLSKILYIPCLYMHFYIEHNFGHHMKVATPEDGATAKYNQSVYAFWIRSVSKQYIDAWKKQAELLSTKNRSFFSLYNDMLWYHLIQPLYLLAVLVLFSKTAVLFAIVAGVISFLFLECINYIEHYGLLRSKTTSGRYERVQTHHSWNSNHNIGRIVLYELTRHSDHHFKSAKKYQLLETHKESPHLPVGYPASILLSLVPPIWFFVMNPRVPKEMKPSV
ncbi:alkane 1-monooxygenase [Flavobacteriaceae bacterium]|nr:alkane 1-monooxygenase [Flavobacteriaceae bacterium]